MDLDVPLIFAKGFPASLNSLSEAQLRCFLKYLWDFTNVPQATQIFPDEHLRPQERKKLLRLSVQNVYDRLGCSYLLNFSEGIAQCNHTSLLFNVDSHLGVVYIWNRRHGKIIARIPQSNLTYDLNLELAESKSPKKSEKQSYKQISDECSLEKVCSNDKGKKHCSLTNNNVIEIESDAEVLEISDDEEPRLLHPNSQVSNVIEIIEDDDTQVEVTVEEEISCLQCEKVWTINSPEIIEVTDSEEECRTESNQQDAPEDSLSRLLISHYSKEQQEVSSRGKRRKSIPKKHVDPDPPPVHVQRSPLPDKPTFLYYFGLCEPTNLPDDPIILPELKKCDFVKFHRLPLNTVPFLANHGLINKGALNPGPPGQNSKFVRLDNSADDKRRNLPRPLRLGVSRHKNVDLENARDYKYPTKTFRTRLPAPLPKKRRKPANMDRFCNNTIQSTTPTVHCSPPQEEVKLKKCFVRIQKLNPFVFRKYYVKRRSK